MKYLYVVGARPNYVKTAPVLAELRRRFPSDEHVVVDTGQHYDLEMSELFRSQLDMPRPDHSLRVGSGTHAEQTARVMLALEPVVVDAPPTLAFVSGDVNSTLGAALVFAKLGIPFAHIESGLRSFDRAMPEEVNRIVADELASLLFAHSEEATGNLRAEGIDSARVHLVGNTMIDSLVLFEPRFRAMEFARNTGLTPGDYLLVTLHRPSLVDGEKLEVVLHHLEAVASQLPVVFPVHPRSRSRIDQSKYPGIRFLPPLGYFEFLSLEGDAGGVLTDSGGVQEETTYLGVPCFTLRSSTERPVTIRIGTNTLLGLEPERVTEIPALLQNRMRLDQAQRPPLWDGRASSRIGDVVTRYFE